MSLRHLGFLILLTATSFTLATVSPASAATPPYDYSHARVVRLSLVEGDVQVSRPRAQDNDDQGNGETWEQALLNLPIQQGYTLATGNGRAEIEFESGATARLAENSVLQLTELALSNGGRITRMTLTQGTATFYAKLSREDSFIVITPNLQVSLPENARFRVDASNDTSTVSVLKGDVQVESNAGTNRLSKGHALAYHTGDDQVQVGRSARADDWDRWVADRDEVVHTASTAALQYVSSPYSYGLSDLYDYGNWYSYGGYGRCWRPRGVGLGWSPYLSGQWLFYPGLGWTWMSFEPWGWLPYHFGSWVLSPGYGWLWVPGFNTFWQPALVSWVRVGNRTGWCPVHPQDRLGGTPNNLQHGFIGNAANPLPGRKGYDRIPIGQGETAQVINAPPAGFQGGHLTPGTGVRSGGPAGGPDSKGRSAREIVFDPRERRFVNNPNTPAHKEDVVREHPADKEIGATPAQRGFSGGSPQKPADSPGPRKQLGDTTPAGPPAKGQHEGAPRQVTPPPAPPRVQTPPSPPPPAKVERPHGQGESLRPAAPAPPRWESAPRPSSPPPMPRSEPRPSAPHSPHS